MMHKITVFFKERWKHLFVCYVVGYFFFSGKLQGTPDLIYFIPINMGAFLYAWVIGNVIYDCFDKKDRKFSHVLKIYCLIKYGTSGLIICFLIYQGITIICPLLGIDTRPFMGI